MSYVVNTAADTNRRTQVHCGVAVSSCDKPAVFAPESSHPHLPVARGFSGAFR